MKLFNLSWNSSQRSAITVSSLTAFIGPFLISGVNIALPAIESEFGLNAVTLSWVVTAYLLASAVFLLIIGRYADIKGQISVFKTGIIIFTIATTLCGIAQNGGQLIAMRVFQGIGASMTITTGAPILVSIFPPAERGKVLGINVASVYLGLSLGPFIGGILTQHFGWRSIFLICIPIGIVTTLLIFLKLKEDHTVRSAGKLDLTGTSFYSAALIAFVYGASNLNKAYGWPLLAAGLLFFALFVVRSLKTEDPVFNISLFTKNRLFAFSNIAALINYSATYSLVFLLSLYLQKIKGYPPQVAGTILVIQPLMMTIISPAAGRLSDRIEPRLLSTLGMLMSSIGLLMFSALNEQTSIQYIISVLLLMGLGFGLFSSPNTNTIMSSVEKKNLGVASGTVATMRVIGQMISMTIATLIFSFYFNGTLIKNVPNNDFIQSARIAFIISGVICLAGIYFSKSRGDLRTENHSGQ